MQNNPNDLDLFNISLSPITKGRKSININIISINNDQSNINNNNNSINNNGENARGALLEAAKLLYKDYLKAKQNLAKGGKGKTGENKGDRLERKHPGNAGRRICCK